MAHVIRVSSRLPPIATKVNTGHVVGQLQLPLRPEV